MVKKERNVDWRGIGEVWDVPRDSMKVSAEEWCGRKMIEGVRRKGCECCIESVEMYKRRRKSTKN